MCVLSSSTLTGPADFVAQGWVAAREGLHCEGLISLMKVSEQCPDDN